MFSYKLKYTVVIVCLDSKLAIIVSIKSSWSLYELENLGRHLALDIGDANYDKLNSVKDISQILDKAVELTGLTVLQKMFHKFEPQGVTALYLLAESHLSIHTFPEYKAAAICAYTCGDGTKFKELQNFLVHAFEANRHEYRLMDRGSSVLTALVEV